MRENRACRFDRDANSFTPGLPASPWPRATFPFRRKADSKSEPVVAAGILPLRSRHRHFTRCLGLFRRSGSTTENRGRCPGGDRTVKALFSTFDPESELSRLNRMVRPFAASGDLVAVLKEYETWQHLSGGACSAKTGALVQAWSDAEKAGRVPHASELASLAQPTLNLAGSWTKERGTVTRTTNHPLNLNSVAKATSFTAFRGSANATARGGRSAARCGRRHDGLGRCVPGRHPGSSAPGRQRLPADVILLNDAAVATSGGYQRFYRIGEKRSSHILDPKTGRPAMGVSSATVTAPTSIMANAVATTLCVLDPREGIRFVESMPGVECLIVTSADKQFRSRGFAALGSFLSRREQTGRRPLWERQERRGGQEGKSRSVAGGT